MKSLNSRNIITLGNLSKKEICQILELSKEIRKIKFKKRKLNFLAIFESNSLYYESIIYQLANELNINIKFINENDFQEKYATDIPKISVTINKFYDGVFFHGENEKLLNEIAFYSEKVIYNLKTNIFEPFYTLAIVYKLYEKNTKLKRKKIAYIGDSNSRVCRELMIVCSKLAINLDVYTNGQDAMFNKLLLKCQQEILKNKAQINVYNENNILNNSNSLIYIHNFQNEEQKKLISQLTKRRTKRIYNFSVLYEDMVVKHSIFQSDDLNRDTFMNIDDKSKKCIENNIFQKIFKAIIYETLISKY